MGIFFGHRTAELILNSPLASDFVPTDETPMTCGFLDQEVLTRFQPEQLNLPKNIQLDVMVPQREQRRRRKGLACHVCSEALPHGAYLEIAPDVFVASPALCLIQQSAGLSFIGRIKLAAQFCGTFALLNNTRQTLVERRPLTTPDDLIAFIDRCPRMRGVRQARRAARWTLPNAASPMEIIMALPFYLPTLSGGFGLPRPTLNYELLLSRRARQIAKTQTVRVDAFWPEFDFGFEYQSEQFHHGDTAYGHDIGRQLAIESMVGTRINMVTKYQLQNITQLERLAEIASEHLGITLNVREGRSVRQALIDNLLAA